MIFVYDITATIHIEPKIYNKIYLDFITRAEKVNYVEHPKRNLIRNISFTCENLHNHRTVYVTIIVLLKIKSVKFYPKINKITTVNKLDTTQLIL